MCHQHNNDLSHKNQLVVVFHKQVVSLMQTANQRLGLEVGTGYLHGLPKSCRNTIGSSVERKIQLVHHHDDNAEDTAAVRQGVVEMVPQLEMEVEPDSSQDDVPPEDCSRQPHELGTREDD